MVFSVKKYCLLTCFAFLAFALSAKDKSSLEFSQNWDDFDAREVVFFVNSANKKAKKKDGSKDAPFGTLDEAMQAISSAKLKNINLKAKIYITGTFSSSYSYIIAQPTKIIGSSHKDSVYFEKNTGFVLSSSYLFLENLSVSRKELVDEPRTVPIFYVSSSTLVLKNVQVKSKEGGTVFSLSESTLSLESSSIFSKQNSYCSVIESSSSTLNIFDSSVDCSSRKIILLDAKNSKINIEHMQASLQSSYFAFFARCFDSNLSITSSSIIAKGGGKAIQAIIHNKNSNLKLDALGMEGFKVQAEIRDNKLDYLK